MLCRAQGPTAKMGDDHAARPCSFAGGRGERKRAKHFIEHGLVGSGHRVTRPDFSTALVFQLAFLVLNKKGRSHSRPCSFFIKRRPRIPRRQGAKNFLRPERHFQDCPCSSNDAGTWPRLCPAAFPVSEIAAEDYNCKHPPLRRQCPRPPEPPRRCAPPPARPVCP